MCIMKSESHSVMSDFLWPHGRQPSRLLCSWDSPDKSTGVGCRSFLTRDRSWVSRIADRFFTIWATLVSHTYNTPCKYIIWCWIQKYEEKYSRLGIERHESCYFNEGGRKGLSTLHWTHSWQKWGSRGEACGCMEEGLPVRGNKGRNPSCSKRRSRWPWASEGEQQEMRSDR